MRSEKRRVAFVGFDERKVSSCVKQRRLYEGRTDAEFRQNDDTEKELGCADLENRLQIHTASAASPSCHSFPLFRVRTVVRRKS